MSLTVCRVSSDSGSRLQPRATAVRDVQQRQHRPRTSSDELLCHILLCAVICLGVGEEMMKLVGLFTLVAVGTASFLRLLDTLGLMIWRASGQCHPNTQNSWNSWRNETRYSIDAACCYRLSSAICWSVCLSVYHDSEPWKKRLNRSRCRLDCGLGGIKEHMLDGGPNPPREVAILRGGRGSPL